MGLLIGALVSCFGAIVSYFLYLRQADDHTLRPLGILLIVNGMLGFIGFMAIITSVFVGQLGLALLVGVGVLIGVVLTFGILLFLWTQFVVSG